MSNREITPDTAPEDILMSAMVDAPNAQAARAALMAAPRSVRLAAADLLYIETEGHGDPYIWRMIISEARA